MSDNNTAAPAAEAPAENTEAIEAVEAEEAEAIEGEGEEASAEEAAAVDKDGLDKPQAGVKQEMYKLKIDGQEVEMTMDEVKRYASLGKAAQKRMEEAAVIRKENEGLKKDINTFFEMLKNDPLSVLGDEALGLDVKKLAQMVMDQEIERAKKSPEQLEIERLQKELAVREKKEKEADEARKRAEWEKMQNEAAASIEKDILEALESKELPKSPYVMSRMINMLHLAAQNGININAKDVLPIVKKQIMDDFKGLTGLLPEEQLEAILGDDKVKGLRKRYLQKVKKVSSAKDIKSTGGDAKTSQDNAAKSKDKMNSRDFFKKLGSI